MAEIPPSIQSALNDLAEKKAEQILTRARQVVGAANISASKELLNSLSVSVKKATANSNPVITLSYADHGRFLDYKNPVWGKLPELDKMEKWVRSRGVSSFRYVSGVGSTGMSEEAKVRKIAAGVAWSKRLHQSKWKPKAWKKKTLVKLLRELNDQTVELWQQGIKLEVENAVKK
jgi:hypothetical protein